MGRQELLERRMGARHVREEETDAKVLSSVPWSRTMAFISPAPWKATSTSAAVRMCISFTSVDAPNWCETHATRVLSGSRPGSNIPRRRAREASALVLKGVVSALHAVTMACSP